MKTDRTHLGASHKGYITLADLYWETKPAPIYVEATDEISDRWMRAEVKFNTINRSLTLDWFDDCFVITIWEEHRPHKPKTGGVIKEVFYGDTIDGRAKLNGALRRYQKWENEVTCDLLTKMSYVRSGRKNIGLVW